MSNRKAKTVKSKKKKTTKKTSTGADARRQPSKSVAIIMGSDSDLAVMSGATEILQQLKIPYHIEVVSAHRTPNKMSKFASSAREKGFKVIIAGAGGAAHLPGMVAAYTTLPVIGVPVNITKLNGLDSLLSIVQMPKGVPVATMAVDNSFNAGLLAARILSISSKTVANSLDQLKKAQANKVVVANRKLRKQIRP